MTRGLAVLSLCAVAALGLGCGDSGDSNGAGGSGATGGSGGNEGSAFLVMNRFRDPSGRTMFLSVLPSLDQGEISLSNALEVSGLSRSRAFNGKVYVFDGEAVTVTRYVVDGDRLVEDVLENGDRARFSMAPAGVTRFTNQIAFIDAERAYYVDLVLDQVVVWSPTEMTITSTFSAPELGRDGFGTTGANVDVIDDFVVVALSWSNDNPPAFVPSAALAIFSASEDRLIDVLEDDRCIIARSTFIDDGDVYLMADAGGGIADLFAPPGTIPPPCLLRWVPGEEDFDSIFYRDLREIVNEPLVSGAVGRGDGTFVTQAYTSDIDPTTLEPLELLDLSLWQWAVVDFVSDTSTLIESIPPGGVSSLGWVVDDQYLVPQFDDDLGSSALYQIEGAGATELLSVTGEIFTVDRIR